MVAEEEKYADGETFQLVTITQLLQGDLKWTQTLLSTNEDLEALLSFLLGQGRAPHFKTWVGKTHDFPRQRLV